MLAVVGLSLAVLLAEFSLQIAALVCALICDFLLLLLINLQFTYHMGDLSTFKRILLLILVVPPAVRMLFAR